MSTKHIHKDIAFSILSKLPLKSLKRFTCVQKSWSLLFENPYFMNMLRKDFLSKHQSLYDDTCLLLSQGRWPNLVSGIIYLFPNERFDLKDRVQLNLPQPFKNTMNIQIVGTFSVNGILCLHNFSKIVLWNPTTDQYKVLPRSIQSYENYKFCFIPQGFFYDSVQDDYKVISAYTQSHWFYRQEEDPCFWVIYSTRSNSWRKLKGDNLRYPSPSNSAVNLNEMCHWLGRRDSDMVSFDFNNEIFITSDLPSKSDKLDGSRFISHLMVLNGSIAYMREYDITTIFHIWILGELGIKKSWTKLFVIGPMSCVWYHRILSGNNGHMFFISKAGELLLFDLKTQEVRKIEVKGGLVHHCIIYKKNLKPLDWGNE